LVVFVVAIVIAFHSVILLETQLVGVLTVPTERDGCTLQSGMFRSESAVPAWSHDVNYWLTPPSSTAWQDQA
jgi:hypothetical protein